MRYFAVAFLLVFLAACSASGPLYTEAVHTTEVDPEKSRVYIYRISRGHLSALSPTILDNGEVVGELSNGGYITYIAEPGSHYLRSKSLERDEPLTIDLEAGRTYYLQLLVVGGLFSPGFEMLPMLPRNALPEISQTRYQGTLTK